MKFVKTLGLLAAIAVATTAFAGVASATTVTSGGSTYTGAIKAGNENGVVGLLRSSGAMIECSSSSLEGKIEKHGAGITVEGALSALAFTGCSVGSTIHVKKTGSLVIHSLAGGNGTVTLSGAEIEVTDKAWGITCIYAIDADLGTLTGSNTTAGKATLDVDVTVPKTGGSFLCGTSIWWKGSYLVNSPENLNVD